MQKISKIFLSVGIEMDLHISRFLSSNIYMKGTFAGIEENYYFFFLIISMAFLVPLTSVGEVPCGWGRKMNNQKGKTTYKHEVGPQFFSDLFGTIQYVYNQMGA